MQKRGRKILAWVAVVWLVLVAGLAVFVCTFDLNRLRPIIDEKVSTAIGRPFAINGHVGITWAKPQGVEGWQRWLPWPRLSAENITVANPAWAATPQFAHLQRISAEVELLPLLQHRISIPEVQLQGPAVDIERLADGRNNWTFAMAPGKDGPAWTLDLGTLVFDRGTVTLSDAQHRLNAVAEIDPLGKPVPFADIMATQTDAPPPAGNTQAYMFGYSITGNYNQARIQADGKIGGMVSLRDASVPLPVQVVATVGDTHIALAGTVVQPTKLGALDVHLKVAGSSLSHLYALTGVALPDTAAFATAGYLHAQLAGQHSLFRYKDFSGHIGSSDVHGNLLFALQEPRPRLSGDMHSNLLQFQDLAPLIGGNKKATDQAAADAAPGKPQPADKLLPVAEFKTDRWAAMDADVQFSAHRITHEAVLPMEDVNTHIVLDDGRLGLQPFSLRTAGGRISGNLHLDGQSTPLQGRLDMQVRELKLQQLVPNVPQMKSALGELNGDLRLKAQGNSVAALAASADGETKLLVEQGQLSRNLLELAGLNLLNVVTGKLFGDKPVDINCAAANLVVEKGQVDPRLFVVDTQNAQINVGGNIDLGTEKMNMNVTPHTKGLRVFSLRAPLYIRGTFKKPDVGVDVGRIALKGGVAVGLGVFLTPAAALLPLISPSHGSDDSCAVMISAMRTPSSADQPGKAAAKVEKAKAMTRAVKRTAHS